MPAPETTAVDSCLVDHRILEAAVARLFEAAGVERIQAKGIAEILVLRPARPRQPRGALRRAPPAWPEPRPARPG